MGRLYSRESDSFMRKSRRSSRHIMSICGAKSCDQESWCQASHGKTYASAFCRDHSCGLGLGNGICMAQKRSKKKYCPEHLTCHFFGCKTLLGDSAKEELPWFCSQHKCLVENCSSSVIDSDSPYCQSHKDYFVNCLKEVLPPSSSSDYYPVAPSPYSSNPRKHQYGTPYDQYYGNDSIYVFVPTTEPELPVDVKKDEAPGIGDSACAAAGPVQLVKKEKNIEKEEVGESIEVSTFLFGAAIGFWITMHFLSGVLRLLLEIVSSPVKKRY